MYAVVIVLDVARERAQIRSLHGTLGEARSAWLELCEEHPNRELSLVQLHRPMAFGAVISREHMALGFDAPARCRAVHDDERARCSGDVTFT